MYDQYQVLNINHQLKVYKLNQYSGNGYLSKLLNNILKFSPIYKLIITQIFL